MAHYYNEIDPYAAQWLRNLIKAGHIPDGEVDTRSIVDVQPDDLRGFRQAHFFCGIAGWPLALKLAGHEETKNLWTGSCPCQPFSVAGKGKGEADERHLWPHFFRLISACRPAYAMGEQVSGKAGANWFDGICSDLESQSYSCEALDIPACAVNSYHQRQRLYWVSSDNLRQRMQRHIKTQSIGQMRQGGASSKVDLRKVFDSPFNRGCGFPQPLIRKMDDGFPSRVGRLRAYGNAIVPPLAAEVIKAFMDTEQ